METASATPAARLDLLDALRGFALLGVLLANLRDFSLHQFLLDTSAIQDGAQRLMAALLDAKAATLFSLLFGVGFAMQMRARADAARRPPPAAVAAADRPGACLAAVVGDILRYYALLGLLLLPMARWSPRRLALAGIVVALFAAPLLAPFAKAWLPAVTPHARAAAEALAAFSGPDPGRAWVANLDYDLRMRLANWSLAGFVLGRLMVGAALGATTLFSHPHERRRAWLGILAAGLAVGMPATAFALRDQQILFNDGWWASADARDAARVIRAAASLSLGLAYMAAFALLFLHGLPRKLLMVFVPAGRMALSNYLAQSLIGVALYYGAGPASVPPASCRPSCSWAWRCSPPSRRAAPGGCGAFTTDLANGCGAAPLAAAGKRCVAGRPPSTRAAAHGEPIMMKSTAIACLAAWTVLGAGCADGTAIATGNRHPPALAANVTLYSAPPGVATRSWGWSGRKAMPA